LLRMSLDLCCGIPRECDALVVLMVGRVATPLLLAGYTLWNCSSCRIQTSRYFITILFDMSWAGWPALPVAP